MTFADFDLAISAMDDSSDLFCFEVHFDLTA